MSEKYVNVSSLLIKNHLTHRIIKIVVEYVKIQIQIVFRSYSVITFDFASI